MGQGETGVWKVAEQLIDKFSTNPHQVSLPTCSWATRHQSDLYSIARWWFSANSACEQLTLANSQYNQLPPRYSPHIWQLGGQECNLGHKGADSTLVADSIATDHPQAHEHWATAKWKWLRALCYCYSIGTMCRQRSNQSFVALRRDATTLGGVLIQAENHYIPKEREGDCTRHSQDRTNKAVLLLQTAWVPLRKDGFVLLMWGVVSPKVRRHPEQCTKKEHTMDL